MSAVDRDPSDCLICGRDSCEGDHLLAIQADAPARLGPMVVDAWRLIHTLRAEYRASSALLGIALEMVRERDVKVARLQERHRALVDELRRYTRSQVERAA